ncbi:hypothetical protein D9611_002545 [Ephemerocybe angulata]|uniref:N-acetyltransferase domain-containing protein n=1 Tax=Ephemerocybe angulata TaxID=980116 RepID=A0A8H5FEC1_9AGAR|nr:hypothetical protein D9611_002545 [Tulosesus angulatus]
MDVKFLTKFIDEEGLDVELMKSEYRWKAADSWTKAFENDLLMKYLSADLRTPPEQSKMVYAHFGALLLYGLTKIVLVIDGGASVLVAYVQPIYMHDMELEASSFRTPSKSTRKSGYLASQAIRFVEWLPSAVTGLKRAADANAKMERMRQDNLGQRKDEMFWINAVFTHPEHQKRGYAGRLLDTLLKLADLSGQGCFLECGPENVAFYKGRGFNVVDNVILESEGSRVEIRLMVREATK